MANVVTYFDETVSAIFPVQNPLDCFGYKEDYSRGKCLEENRKSDEI